MAGNVEGEKMKNERERLERKLSKLTEEKRSLAQKIGNMARTPKYSYGFNGALLGKWLKDYERLLDREDVLRAQLLEFACR